MNNKLNEIICYLLENMTDPFPRYILRNDVLNLPVEKFLVSNIEQSKWYRQLADEQWENGSWGRFHSMDSRMKDKHKFLTTEAALRRARELSLTKDAPVVEKCISLMERYLKGDEIWLDYTEKHHDNGKSFLVAFPFLIAANLSLFDAENPLVKSKRDICVKILEKSFASGCFNEDVWEEANHDYTGTCLKAWTVYPLWLLQNTDCIAETLQRQYLSYIWNRNEGIYYISNTAPSELCYLEDKGFTTWLSALESLSGFSLFSEFMKEEILLHLIREIERLMDGDVKLPAAHSITGHYTESWKEKEARRNDLILRIMCIVVKCEI